MTEKRARPPVRWVEGDDGEYRREVDDVVIATIGERRYEVPAVIEVGGEHLPPVAVRATGGAPTAIRLEEGRETYVMPVVAHLTGEVRISEGRPAFSRVELTIYEPMTPTDLARIPWGQYAEAITAAAASPRVSDRREVREARQRADRTDRARRSRASAGEALPRGGRPYRRGTDELLDEVERLRAEAEAEGLPYARYIGEKLGYVSDSYVRRLAKKARHRRA